MAPLRVQFDASQSSDPDGDPLSYSWSFGDGSHAAGVQVSHTFQSAQVYEVVLTVKDNQGATAMATIAIEVEQDNPTPGNCGDLLSAFAVPRSTPLPSINYIAYDYIHVFGNSNLDLSQVTDFTMNWANETTHNGLYQFSMMTNNGKPNWWNDLRNVSTHTFLLPNPQVTFSGSGFRGLDGTYFVNVDDQQNFVMIEESGAYAIYFSNSSQPPFECTDAETFVTPTNVASALKPVQVFPNPTREILTVRGVQKGQLELRIFNAKGDLEMIQHITTDQAELQINLESLSKGVHFIQIKGERYYKQIRILKR